MEFFSTTFDIGLFIFGCMSVFGILFFNYQLYFSSKVLTKIGTVAFCLQFGLVFVIRQSAVIRCVSVFAVIAGCLLVMMIYIRILEQQMLNQVHHSIKNVILQMKLGAGFRRSLELSMQYETSPFMKTWLRKIHDNVVFTQHKNLQFRSQLLLKLISELKLADKDQQSAQKRLENLYSWLKIQSDFRRKSGKVLSQIRIQSAFILVIYFATTIFVSRFIGFNEVIRFFPLSVTLMFLGILFVFYFGRKMKWSL